MSLNVHMRGAGPKRGLIRRGQLSAVLAKVSAAPASSTVLVVEDEVLLRADISDELRQAGYTVVEASSGHAALEILTSAMRIGLVCTDIRMPGDVDGIALARWIKTNHPYLPVIIVSAEAKAFDCRTLADAAFTKPVDLAKLLSRIVDLLPRNGGQRSPLHE